MRTVCKHLLFLYMQDDRGDTGHRCPTEALGEPICCRDLQPRMGTDSFAAPMPRVWENMQGGPGELEGAHHMPCCLAALPRHPKCSNPGSPTGHGASLVPSPVTPPPGGCSLCLCEGQRFGSRCLQPWPGGWVSGLLPTAHRPHRANCHPLGPKREAHWCDRALLREACQGTACMSR